MFDAVSKESLNVWTDFSTQIYMYERNYDIDAVRYIFGMIINLMKVIR